MAATYTVLAQTPFQQLAAASGNQYTADQYGYFKNVPAGDLRDFIISGLNIVGTLDQLNNLTATTDPGVSNDNTQDYSVGSLWLNTSNSRAWRALGVATGAAVWILEGIVPGVGVDPANMLTQFGGGTGSFTEEGNLYKLFSGGTNPASTGSDIVMANFSLPAGSLDQANRLLQLNAAGNFANNTNVKTAKLWVNATTAVVGSAITGGTAIATTGAYSTTGAAGWQLIANFWKYGIVGSNTQAYQEMDVVIAGTHSGMGVAAALTLNESLAINLSVTLNAATTATDASLWQFYINAMN